MDPNASHITEVVDQKKSTKQRLDALDGQSTRLCVAVEAIEEKVETAKAEIRELNIQLEESRMMCAAMTDAVALLPDLREEMEAMRLQLRILQRAVGNGQAPAQEYAPRLKIPEPAHLWWRRAMLKKLRTSCSTWNNTFLLPILKKEQEE
ncbi:Retrotrans gag domain-containing protein [Abeliophyllum distichum]|uniref:Retrotrans gag domain-containing protein n=1 Tax=Abeliophyllum distichum TaxID=126358 RepID=A0ABD1QZB0_9LAMI